MLIPRVAEVKFSFQTLLKKKIEREKEQKEKKKKRFISPHIRSRRTGASSYFGSGLWGPATASKESMNSNKIL